jgi:TetR/AcrR family transcriptional repressor of mexJK operon
MILDSTASMEKIDSPTANAQDERRAMILATARAVFLKHGYGGTTMSAISTAVGGSKTTLWSYFPSKEELFTAVVDDVVEHFGCSLTIELSPDLPVAEMLEHFAAAMLSTMLSPPIVGLYRLVTGEVGRFPELGQLFYERGPRRGKARLANYIEQAMADGRLRKGDPAQASRQFSAMCQSNSFQLALFGIGTPKPDTVARDITAAVDSFLRAWGPETA